MVTLIGGPYDGMTVEAPHAMTIVLWSVADRPGEGVVRYNIHKLEPELKAYYDPDAKWRQQKDERFVAQHGSFVTLIC